MNITTDPPERVTLLGSPIDCVDMAGALNAVDRLVRGERARTVLAVNPEKIIQAQSDPVLRRALSDAGLLIPDGIGAVMAVRLLRRRRLARVPGAELMPGICSRAVENGYRLFLFGASEEANAGTVNALRRDYPGIDIVGRHHGYVDEHGMQQVIDSINASGANIVFVALGSPKQELWMERYLPYLPQVRVCQGVGGTFDVLAGRVQRAPATFRKLHLEWFYRLMSQPRRLLRQTALPRFAWQVACSLLMRPRT